MFYMFSEIVFYILTYIPLNFTIFNKIFNYIKYKNHHIPNNRLISRTKSFF